MTAVQTLPILLHELLVFADELVTGGSGTRQKENLLVVLAYGVFASLSVVTWRHFSDRDFSFVCTLACSLQTLGFVLLNQKVQSSRSVAGISLKMLKVYVLVFTFRLSSTLVKHGYLPVCKSGDWVCQAFDLASLFFVLQLLYRAQMRYSNTYQADLDSMPVMWPVIGAGLLGCALHGDMNGSPFFDITWMISMWLDTLAMMPQLWLFVMRGGAVEAITANFVALIFVSKCFSFAFWYTGYMELAPADGGVNVAGYAIIGGHALQLLLSADFMYHYFVWKKREMSRTPLCGSAPLQLGGAESNAHGAGKFNLPSISGAELGPDEGRATCPDDMDFDFAPEW